MKLLVETAALTGTPMASTMTGTLRKPPPTPSRPETAPATPETPMPTGSLWTL